MEVEGSSSKERLLSIENILSKLSHEVVEIKEPIQMQSIPRPKSYEAEIVDEQMPEKQINPGSMQTFSDVLPSRFSGPKSSISSAVSDQSRKSKKREAEKTLLQIQSLRRVSQPQPPTCPSYRCWSVPRTKTTKAPRRHVYIHKSFHAVFKVVLRKLKTSSGLNQKAWDWLQSLPKT